ncbi:MAG TPA: UvrD-helicase domain-containing protein [Polyangiaceae bacterium]|nr:UvrD-helicase domain-containing protein [Polyangiaceae bacterium]
MASPDLNGEQRRAVMTHKGPLLVLAGAGSGKTRVITYRIAELIRRGTKPDRILAVTFTNKAAREMRERAMGLLGKRRKGVKGPEISTFHSLCVRILRRNIERLGYPAQFSIYDENEQESIARSTLRDLRVGQEKLRPGDLLSIIGGWKSRGVRPSQAEGVARNDRESLAAMAFERYQGALRAAGAVDFDDLLLCTEELFDRFEDVRTAEARRFDHILIDEYQDTNDLQYRIVVALAKDHRNLCVVGDDDQSIYGWRGAEIAHILGFAKDWPGATVVRLEDNYRCRESILGLANTLIAHNKNRHDKVLRAARGGGDPPRFLRFESELTEATEIVREIRARTSPEKPDRVSFRDIAILFRTNEQPRAFEVELRRERIPYLLVGGQSFYDRKEIRDVLAYLKVLANPTDEVSLLRIINTPRRGISDGVVETVLKRAVEAGKSLWEVLPEAVNDGDVPHYAGERISAFKAMVDRFRLAFQAPGANWAEVFQGMLREMDYKSELDRAYKNPGDSEARWESVGELVNTLATYQDRADAPSLREYLDETTLSRDDLKKEDERPSAVTLMTLHSAKGLEFPYVYMVGMEEGLLPHRRAVEDLGGAGIDEERRLCYVGVTRAKDQLTLSFARARMKWGKERPGIPSRFLMEMRGETEKAARAAEAAQKLFASEGFGQRPPPAAADGKKTPKKGAAAKSAASAKATGGAPRKKTATPAGDVKTPKAESGTARGRARRPVARDAK